MTPPTNHIPNAAAHRSIMAFTKGPDGWSDWCRLCGKWADSLHLQKPKHVEYFNDYMKNPRAWKSDELKEMPEPKETPEPDGDNGTFYMAAAAPSRVPSTPPPSQLEDRVLELEAKCRDLTRQLYSQNQEILMLKENIKGIRQDRRPKPY